MKQVADTVFKLGTRSHNFYFLVEEGAVTMIDAGCSREWRQVEAGLSELGLPLDAISAVIATHAHADHFGLAKEAMDRGVRVEVHAEEETRALGTYEGRFAVSTSELPKFNLRALSTFIPMVRAGVMTLDHVDRVGTFVGEESLDLPGRPVPVHTPGHTEGHTMFHCPDLGVLFTGDGLITMDLLSSTKGPQMIEDRFSLDADEALRSLDRIVDLEAELLLPGHGDPWAGGPRQAVEMVRSGA